MKIGELEQDLLALGLEDNLNQAKLIYLFATRKGIPLIIEGAPNTGKEFLVSQVLSLFSPYKNIVSPPAIFLPKQFFGDKTKALVISTNTSEEAVANLLRLQRERRTIEGIVKMREEDLIRSKHIDFRGRLENVKVSIPLNINTGKGITLLDQEVFLNLMEAIAFLDQKDRVRQEKGCIFYIEATEEDFYAAKEILVNTPVFEAHNSLSPEALELAKDLLCYADKNPDKANKLTRDDLLRACGGKYKTFKPIGNKKRLPELIEAGYIDVVKRGGLKNGYMYAFSNTFSELDSGTLAKNRFAEFSLSSLTSFSSLAKEETLCTR